MSNLSSGLIPLNSASSSSLSKSKSSLTDAPPPFSKSKFNSKSDPNNSDEDLDALFDDEPISLPKNKNNSSYQYNQFSTKSKFKSTMKDFSDSDDNYNFEDSLSSTNSSPKKSGTKSLLPSKVDNITDKNKSSQRSNLLSDDKSLADEDLEDSLLGGLLEIKDSKKSTPNKISFKLPSAAKSHSHTSTYSNNETTEPPPIPTPSSFSNENNEEDTTSEGFIPSFLDSKRQNRSRRLIPAKSGGLVSSSQDFGNLDELDKALGIGPSSRTLVKDPFAQTNSSPPSKDLPSFSSTLSSRNARSTSNINMSSSDSDDDNNNKLFQNNFSSNSNIKNRSVSPVESILENKNAKKEKESNFAGSSSSSQPAASNKVSFNLPQLGAVASNNKSPTHSNTPTPTLSSTTKYPQQSASTPTASSRRSNLTINTNTDNSLVKSKSVDASDSASSPKLSRNNSQSDRGFASDTNTVNNKTILSSDNSSTQTNLKSPAASSPSPQANISRVNSNDSDQGIVITTKTAAGSYMSPVDREKDRTIMALQQKLEESSVHREAVERNLRLEVDSLKTRLAISSEQFFETSGTSSGQSNTPSSSGDLQAKLLRELTESKRTISILEQEIGRLKDETNISALRHHEELNFTKQRAATELEEAEKKRESDIANIESRHNFSIQALKKIHNEEILAIKERSKENAALETLAAQIRSSTGSMRLIEEQLHVRYNAAELMKEGQLEARERLVKEMEEKARERTDLAEAESFRLKGLLMHMEQMVTSLRAQNSDDKDRLRMEHSRLQNMQTSLENDKSNFNRRMEEENNILNKKLLEVQHESRRIADEKRIMLREVMEEKNQLEEAKKDFQSHVTASTKAVETGIQRIKDEERKLNAIRDEFAKEKFNFEQYRENALKELSAADIRYKNMVASIEDMNREKAVMNQTAREVQEASSAMIKKDEELEQWAADLAKRENLLERKVLEMKKASTDIKRRESDMATLNNVLENQKLALVKLDHAIIQKSTEYSSSYRKNLMSQGKRNYDELLDINTASENTFNQVDIPISSYNMIETASHFTDTIPLNNNTPSNNTQTQLFNQFNYRDSRDKSLKVEDIDTNVLQADYPPNSTNSTGLNNRIANLPKDFMLIDKELNLARKSMMSARNTLYKSSDVTLKTDEYLNRELSFINNINSTTNKFKLPERYIY